MRGRVMHDSQQLHRARHGAMPCSSCYLRKKVAPMTPVCDSNP